MGEPFVRHTSTQDIYDEFKTPRGDRLTVVYHKGKIKDIQLRVYTTHDGRLYEDFYLNPTELRNILSMMHAGVASINKKEISNGSEE